MEPEVVVEEHEPEQEAPPPTGRLGRIPSDLTEAVDTSFSEGHEIGGDTRLATDRYGRRHVVSGEDGESLHPGLRTEHPPIDARVKWRRTQDGEETVKLINEQFGGTRADANGFPVSQPPPQEPAAEPAETLSGPSDARKIADSLDAIYRIAREHPGLVRTVMDMHEPPPE